FVTWATAATNIQDAVDVVMSGTESLVLVTNGIYQSGSRRSADGTSNRVMVTKALRLQSVNGPIVTVIDGGDLTRCVYLTNLAVLQGFTLTRGSAGLGAGVWCQSDTASVSDCQMVANIARTSGGGVYGGTIYNCALTRNTAPLGGGGYAST